MPMSLIIPEEEKEPVVALFNFGGGLRGLVPAHIMTRIEKDTGLRMSEMVDIFCGPSTGAILNAAMNVPHPEHPHRSRYRARHMVRFYEREGQNIFPQDRFRELRGLLHDFNNRLTKISQLESVFKHGHYNPTHLGTALRALFGHTKLSDSLKSLIIPFYSLDGADTPEGFTKGAPTRAMVHYAREGGHAVWLRNMKLHNGQHHINSQPHVSMFDAVMASCAAPTYFPCHHFSVGWNDVRGTKEYAGIDGNIFDNPAVSYYGSLKKQLDPHQKLVMIGLGTGYTNRSIKREKWNKYGSLGVVDPVNDLPLINIFFHASESALSHSFMHEMGDNLYMFNRSILDKNINNPSYQIDDGSPENLKKLRDFAETIMEDNASQLDEVCDILVRNYDKRTIKRAEKQKEKKGFFAFLGLSE